MTDDAFMALALVQAEHALGSTAPNPPVGAVLVRAGVVLGAGFTQPAGHDHAEVRALADCRANGHDPRGATMYVTLEPCCHHGRTPPCTSALLAAGVARVVVGAVDPFPPMQGRALALLRNAGLTVDRTVTHAEACARRVLGFARAVTHGLPEVTLKAAISLDGNIATEAGESQWITGATSRRAAHQLRARHDAVLVGIGTVLADNPRLTTRVEAGSQTIDAARARNAVPVVLDTQLRTPADAALLTSGLRPIIICGERAPERVLPADLVRVPTDAHGHVDVRHALSALAARGLHRVLVEGGGQVYRALLDAHLVDQVEIFCAGVVIAGGRSWVAGSALESLGAAKRMTLVHSEPCGGDLWSTWRVAHQLDLEVA